MASVNLKSLVGKLNQTCRRGLEGAVGLCVSRTNHNVELEHFLLKLIEPSDTDLVRIFKQYNVDTGKVNRELTRAIESLRTGNARSPELSLDILDVLREAWVLASLEFGAGRIRSGYLIAALLNDRNLSARITKSSSELAKIPAEQLAKNVKSLISGTAEDQFEPGEAPPTTTGDGGQQVRADSKTPNLDQFTTNLTDVAKQGKIDPVIGRDFEIRQVVDILLRRRQNNPLLAGEAGVGKTAVVEGFALKVATGDVPPPLRGVAVRTLDLGLLQAGAGVKGEFENRLKSVIAEVKASPQPIILFIDEAHTLIGAGGGQGMGDAANLLKPALARGELRTIAATTWSEYKKSFENDPALKRRFQVVKVDEPDVEKATRMMRGLTATLEKHHKVAILDEAIMDTVKLSHRYITDRQLPDKAVSLLDTACAKVSLGLSATPAAIEDCTRDIEFFTAEIAILTREEATGAAHPERLQELRDKKKAAEDRKASLEKRFAEEKKMVEDIQKLRKQLTDSAEGKDPKAKLSADDEQKAKASLGQIEKDLKKLQGESPLVQPVVDSQAVAEVVSGWTGIPIGRMVLDEIKTILTLKEKMEDRIIGQSHALDAISQSIRTSRAGMADPRRPIGVFFMVGPSGVGKTETAMALSDILYGGDRNMVIINMSEYKESHKISRLTGSAPGYVGYGEGGVLTEAVRRKPYSIVLLDEVEKSHPDVQEVFYQVFDKGMLQDDKGEEIDFKNTIIILTSNVGTDTIMKVCADPDTRPDMAGLAEALRPDLLKVFKPALLGRMKIVPYFPLTDEVLQKIIELNLNRIKARMRENHKASFTWDENLIKTISSRCKEVETGARNIDHILTGSLLPEVSGEVLSRMAEGHPIHKVHVGISPEGKFVYNLE